MNTPTTIFLDLESRIAYDKDGLGRVEYVSKDEMFEFLRWVLRFQKVEGVGGAEKGRLQIRLFRDIKSIESYIYATFIRSRRQQPKKWQKRTN